MAANIVDFPHLFAETDLGSPQITARFGRRYAPPPLISNTYCVSFVGDQCVLVTLADGAVEVTGGTLEPDEPYEDALRRELLEEAGAHLLSFAPLGAWRTQSSSSKPFRPHLPHPIAYRYVVHAEVELVSQPTNVGEQVTAVEVVPVDAAAARFRAIGRPELAELYLLAALVRSKH
jgi:8-oxo-dGTP pyrophosphatase MutT (NUDIX family)